MYTNVYISDMLAPKRFSLFGNPIHSHAPSLPTAATATCAFPPDIRTAALPLRKLRNSQGSPAAVDAQNPGGEFCAPTPTTLKKPHLYTTFCLLITSAALRLRTTHFA